MSTQVQSRYSRTKSASYESLKSPELKGQKALVMACFTSSDSKFTRKHIAVLTQLELSCICGRVCELMDDGLLVDRGDVKDQDTGKTQQLVGLPVKA